MVELREEGVLVEYELALRRRDGSPIWVVAHSRLVDDPEEGRVIEGIFIDVTERVRARRALRERERRFRELAEHIEEEYRIVRPDGEVRWIRDRAFPIEDENGEVRRIGGIAEDITEWKQAERELEHRGLHDQLTGLPNRDLLRDRFRQAIRRSQRRGESLAVAYVDLDEFKPINDEYGHQAGDRVLVEVADRLRDRTRDEDTVSRMGGDEVVDELIRRSDRAMYEAKEGGGGGYRLTRFSDGGP